MRALGNLRGPHISSGIRPCSALLDLITSTTMQDGFDGNGKLSCLMIVAHWEASLYGSRLKATRLTPPIAQLVLVIKNLDTTFALVDVALNFPSLLFILV